MSEITKTKCSICTGKQGDREKINEMLAKSIAHTEISKATKVPARTISNHALHVGEILEQAKAQNILEQSINIDAEFREQLKFVKKLRTAAERWLIDPSNPDYFTLEARGDEIDVIYLDHNDKDGDGNPKRKKESLQSILARIDDKGFSALSWSSKHTDLRDIALKTLDRTDATLTQFAKLGGLYITNKEKEMEERLAQLEMMLKLKINV